MEKQIEQIYKVMTLHQRYKDTMQAAIYIGGSTDQIKRAVKNGKLRVLVGADGVRRFDTVELDRFVRAEEMQNPPVPENDQKQA